MPRDKEGNPRTLVRKDFEEASRSSSRLENLQREIYTRWGVKIDVRGAQEGREPRRGDLTTSSVARRLAAAGASPSSASARSTSMDRIIGAMVEESCPPREAAGGLGLGRHLPGLQGALRDRAARTTITEHDAEELAHEPVRSRREARSRREKEIGTELVLRIFRHFYLEELDKAVGRSPRPTWITCATASVCAGTARRTRSRSTRKRATTSS